MDRGSRCSLLSRKVAALPTPSVTQQDRLAAREGWETTVDSRQFTPQPGPPEERPACALKEEDAASAAAARPSTSAEALQAAAPGVWDPAPKPVAHASENTLPPRPPGDGPRPPASAGPGRGPRRKAAPRQRLRKREPWLKAGTRGARTTLPPKRGGAGRAAGGGGDAGGRPCPRAAPQVTFTRIHKGSQVCRCSECGKTFRNPRIFSAENSKDGKNYGNINHSLSLNEHKPRHLESQFSCDKCLEQTEISHPGEALLTYKDDCDASHMASSFTYCDII
ncbi:hypothetical protein JEQ12_005799 [Ovis aries]|uniref:Uncharacterized protein n=1 Tax=Ovis aries TaxID=9940 RepID=A0A836CXK0_SHEEP|nr:hypothetical protein JEQ12_005799 [Ovis aries]